MASSRTDRLTIAVDQLETALGSADLETAIHVAHDTAVDRDLIEAALIVRERIGVLNPLIHAAVITQTIPLLLEEGEQLVKCPLSLQAMMLNGSTTLRPPCVWPSSR
jgi:hypothetical protein